MLDRAIGCPMELVVEESGSLSGLMERLVDYGPDYFDVLHISGHADIVQQEPIFIMEDWKGQSEYVSPKDLAAAIQPHWPGLIFLSGCKTGGRPGKGHVPSFCEQLIEAGAQTVIGWSVRVGDAAASIAAATLYRSLANGMTVDKAVRHTRLQLLKEKSDAWHTLRWFVGGTPTVRLVEPHDAFGAEWLKHAIESVNCSDHKQRKLSTVGFVGRRRALQRCLRCLDAGLEDKNYYKGILLTGMGGLGKTSLAIRLCTRLPKYKHIVWNGHLDEHIFFENAVKSLTTSVKEGLCSLVIGIDIRMKKLLSQLTDPVLFVFDGFEENGQRVNEFMSQFDKYGRMKMGIDSLTIICELLNAIHETESDSRVIICCRYQFDLSFTSAKILVEPLEHLFAADLTKKISNLPMLHFDRESEMSKRAMVLADGNPRLLEVLNGWLENEVMSRSVNALLENLETIVATFRNDLMLADILEKVKPNWRKLLGKIALCSIPVPLNVVMEMANANDLADCLEQASNLGIVECVNAGQEGKTVYVSGVLKGILVEKLSDLEKIQTHNWLAQAMYQLWWENHDAYKLATALEIFNHAREAKALKILYEVVESLAAYYNGIDRYREARDLCNSVLELGSDSRVLNQLGRSEYMLGDLKMAADSLNQAMSDCRGQLKSSDENGVVVSKLLSCVLCNLALVEKRAGRYDYAIELWQEALTYDEQIGDLHGQSVSYYYIAWVHVARGQVDRALELLELSLSMLGQLDKRKERGLILSMMAEALASKGEIDRALQVWHDSLTFLDEVGSIKGKATALSNMARTIAQCGEVEHARQLWNESILLNEQIGDVLGKAASLHNLAGLTEQLGEVDQALKLWGEALKIFKEADDAEGEASTLGQMAIPLLRLGNLDEAQALWTRSYALNERIGCVDGMFTNLSNMAAGYARYGHTELALEYWHKALLLAERFENVSNKAVTLVMIARIIAIGGRVKEARELLENALLSYTTARNINGQALALCEIAKLTFLHGQAEQAISICQNALALHVVAGDKNGEAETLFELAAMQTQRGQVGLAAQFLEESLMIYTQLRDVKGIAAVKNQMAGIEAEQGQSEHALALWNESIMLCQKIGDIEGKAVAMHNMAGILERNGYIDRAVEIWQECLPLFEQIGDVRSQASAMHNLGKAHTRLGAFEFALQQWQNAYNLFGQIGDWAGKASVLNEMARLYALLDHDDLARGLWSKALEIHERKNNIKNKATVMANLAWIEGKANRVTEQLIYHQQALNIFIQIKAWEDVAKLLYYMWKAGPDENVGEILQATWLLTWVQAPMDDVLDVVKEMVTVFNEDSCLQILLVSLLFSITIKDVQNPSTPKVNGYADALLEKHAPLQAMDKRRHWLQQSVQQDPRYFMPRLRHLIEVRMNSYKWVFDRGVFPTEELT